jgi:hypothetical protein
MELAMTSRCTKALACDFVPVRGSKPAPSARAQDEYQPHRRLSPWWGAGCFVQVAIVELRSSLKSVDAAGG